MRSIPVRNLRSLQRNVGWFLIHLQSIMNSLSSCIHVLTTLQLNLWLSSRCRSLPQITIVPSLILIDDDIPLRNVNRPKPSNNVAVLLFNSWQCIDFCCWINSLTSFNARPAQANAWKYLHFKSPLNGRGRIKSFGTMWSLFVSSTSIVICAATWAEDY